MYFMSYKTSHFSWAPKVTYEPSDNPHPAKSKVLILNPFFIKG